MLIASALWGVAPPRRPHPRLPLLGQVEARRLRPALDRWRPQLAAALPDKEGGLVVDMRSAAYATAWKPKRATLLPVRAFTEVDGERKAISHMVKAVRGDVARALLGAKKPAADPRTRRDRQAGRVRGRALRHRPRCDRRLSGVAPFPSMWRIRGRAPARSAGSARSRVGRVSTGTAPSSAIVSRFDSSTGLGASGQGVSTTAATSSPAARAASIVSSVWLIVPSPGEAATTSGRPRSRARSRTR